MVRLLGEATGLEVFLKELDYCLPRWSVVFVAECDFQLCDEYTPDLDYIEERRHRFFGTGQGKAPYPFAWSCMTTGLRS